MSSIIRVACTHVYIRLVSACIHYDCYAWRQSQHLRVKNCPNIRKKVVQKSHKNTQAIGVLSGTLTFYFQLHAVASARSSRILTWRAPKRNEKFGYSGFDLV